MMKLEYDEMEVNEIVIIYKKKKKKLPRYES